MEKGIHNLSIPNLDDKTFAELVNEARARIPLCASEWTDHNLSDPGITFLELFAWLVEMQIYSLNLIPERNYLKFLKLLGVKPKPAIPAKVDVTFTSSRKVLVRKGTQVRAIDDGMGKEIIFETDMDLTVLPLGISLVGSLEVTDSGGYKYTNCTSANARNGVFYHAFGERAKRGSVLNLLFTNVPPGQEMTSMVYVYESDLPIRGKHGAELPEVSLSSQLVWEHWKYLGPYSGKWETLEIQDDTMLLTQNGSLSFTIPLLPLFSVGLEYESALNDGVIPYELEKEFWNNWVFLSQETTVLTQEIDSEWTIDDAYSGRIYRVRKEEGRLNIYPLLISYFQIRCRIEKEGYEIPPRIDTIKLNTISATHGKTVEGEVLGQSSGLPNQLFSCRNQPIIVGSQKVVIFGEEWEAQSDLDSSGPEDKHYVLDPNGGKISFGDGVNGQIPPKGSDITITYRTGGGEDGNIPANATWKPLRIQDGSESVMVRVHNDRPAYGWAQQESLEAALVRLRRDLRVPYRAVTTDDYETIAKNTPGLRVARAHAVSCPKDNLVTVTVVPFSTLERPYPSQGFIDTVYKHLDKHRLITSKLKVVPPGYVQVSVKNATVRIRSLSDRVALKNRIEKALNSFLHPLNGGPDGSGWSFGRNVYRSEIYAVIEAVDGVDYVAQLELKGTDEEDRDYRNQNGNISIPPSYLVYPGIHDISIEGF